MTISLSDNISERAIYAIKIAWDIFSYKVGSGLIIINKEASMQLQYAHILHQLLPLIIFKDNEKIDIELETTANDGHNNREIDILVLVYRENKCFKIAIELKCYKKLASSGGPRGATDIFMKDVYMDLHLLERYSEMNYSDYGIGLVMTDHKAFLYPKKKQNKCWDYDISQGNKVGNLKLTTPIGGKPVDIYLKHNYEFNWIENENYAFVLLEKIEQ